MHAWFRSKHALVSKHACLVLKHACLVLTLACLVLTLACLRLKLECLVLKHASFVLEHACPFGIHPGFRFHQSTSNRRALEPPNRLQTRREVPCRSPEQLPCACAKGVCK